MLCCQQIAVPPNVVVFFSPSGVQFGFAFIKNLLLTKLPTIKVGYATIYVITSSSTLYVCVYQ